MADEVEDLALPVIWNTSTGLGGLAGDFAGIISGYL